ncbi:MAG TPA: ATP-binding cassette domain-containing protein [Anaerolineaceae bacterium]|nr:ATP-binding cassette domain-containing protein [Anaerolineaceae bacterium]
MDKFDYLIIGAGMGGLSAGNFLAKYKKKVLILEKHNIPGGLVTSFKRKGVQFDLGIESLYELKEGQTIPQFLEFWGTTITAQQNTGDLCCFIDGKRYAFRHDRLREDFLAAFPDDQADVNRIFDINERMYREMNSGTGAPKPPYEMNFLELIWFGMNNFFKRPIFMKYGLKDARVVLDKLTQNPVLRSAIFSKGIFPMVYMAYAYRLNVVGKDYYPTGGMQAIPDASVESFTANGGVLKLNTEVAEILIENGRAVGVRTNDGACYRAGTVISNASPQFTYDLLPDGLPIKDKVQQKLQGREIFPGVCALFLSVKDDYDFGKASCFSFLSSTSYRDDYKTFTPENCPIEMVVYPKKPGDTCTAAVALFLRFTVHVLFNHLNLRYSDGTESLHDVSLNVEANAITVLFGPAGGGKSTLLRMLNRLNDLADVVEVAGKVLFNGEDLLDPKTDVTDLRRRVGMVFSRPTPLPMSIAENITYGMRLAGERRKASFDEAVERSLRQAVLWDEVYDRLNTPAMALSGGQQQRLCIARTLALKPEVILLDEPTSALDPISTAKIEGSLQELKQEYTIVLAPHNTQQAARTADYAAFFLQGELVEYSKGKGIFTTPKDPRTNDYVEGRFG